MVCEDITERKRLERQLMNAQKMEAIGTLSGGIAHDFNNILMGIQGYASLMMLDIGRRPSAVRAAQTHRGTGKKRGRTDGAAARFCEGREICDQTGQPE